MILRNYSQVAQNFNVQISELHEQMVLFGLDMKYVHAFCLKGYCVYGENVWCHYIILSFLCLSYLLGLCFGCEFWWFLVSFNLLNAMCFWLMLSYVIMFFMNVFLAVNKVKFHCLFWWYFTLVYFIKNICAISLLIILHISSHDKFKSCKCFRF